MGLKFEKVQLLNVALPPKKRITPTPFAGPENAQLLNVTAAELFTWKERIQSAFDDGRSKMIPLNTTPDTPLKTSDTASCAGGQ